VLFLPYSLIEISPMGGLSQFLHFMIIENIISSIIIFSIYKLLSKIKEKSSSQIYNYAFSPYFSIMILIAAIYVQWAI
jgi:hypothetical protein